MTNTIKKIGVLTSGGDAPGMSTAVRAVALAALKQGIEVVAIYEGYKGLIYKNLKSIKNTDVLNYINAGGTTLLSDRCDEFKTEEGMAKAIATCKEENIDAIIAIGGDGTFRGATDLSHRGIPTIGIPATIDNDITSTDYALGFDTAMNTNLMLGDRLRDTCWSHARCNVIEIMGRGAGYLALQSGIALGATIVAIPECDFDEEAAIAKLKAARAGGQRSFIIAVAEGFPAKDGVPYGEYLTKRINTETKAEGAWIDTKFCRPAHMVRGGAPTLRDRLMAAQFAEKAVELILAGKSDVVVCARDGKIVETDISYALILDRMYKGKLKDGDLEKFSAEQVEAMKAFCAMRKADLDSMYALAELISH